MSEIKPDESNSALEAEPLQKLDQKSENLKDAFKYLSQSVYHSQDRPTRKYSLLFFISLLGSLIVFAMGVRHYFYLKKIQNSDEQKYQEVLVEDHLATGQIHDQADQNAQKKIYPVFDIGSYRVELLPIEGQRELYGVLNLAELSFTIECETPESCHEIEKNLPFVQDKVTQLFVAMDRHELLSYVGKKKIKEAVQRALNQWLGKDEIRNIYITKIAII